MNETDEGGLFKSLGAIDEKALSPILRELKRGDKKGERLCEDGSWL